MLSSPVPFFLEMPPLSSFGALILSIASASGNKSIVKLVRHFGHLMPSVPKSISKYGWMHSRWKICLHLDVAASSGSTFSPQSGIPQ